MPFQSFGDALRHRIVLAVGIICVFLLVAVGATLFTRPTYRATATLFVDVRGQDTLLRQSDGLLGAQFVQQATSRKVLEETVRSLKLQGVKPDSLSKRVHASVAKAAPEILITAEGPSAVAAADLATGVATALITVHKADVKQLDSQTRGYLSGELTRLETEIQQLGNPAPGSAALARLTLLQNQYSTTYAHLQNVDLGQAELSDALSLQQNAQPPTAPSAPDPIRYLLVALIGGVATAVIAVLLAERLDDRLSDAEALARATGTTVALDLSRHAPKDPSESAYALLRASLLARFPQASVAMVVPVTADDYALPVAMQLRKAQEQGERNGFKESDTSSAETCTTTVRRTEKRARKNTRATTDEDLRALADDPTYVSDEVLSGLSVGAANSARNGSSREQGSSNHVHAFDEDLLVLAVASPRSGSEAFETARRADLAILVATARQTRFAEAQYVAQALRNLNVVIAASVLIPKLNQAAGKHS
jgi:capsular polysaccharide biosynthesis protein